MNHTLHACQTRPVALPACPASHASTTVASETDSALRDVAFVLRMTMRVREDMARQELAVA